MATLFKPLFTIDGRAYNVAVVSLKRKAAILDGENAGRTMSGIMMRDIIGTYYNYDLTLGTSLLSPSDYDALYEILTAPVDSHMITMPYGQETKTFRAYISNANDALIKMNRNNMWSSLTVTFTAMEPARRP